jgi:hypothetical protein
MKSNNDKFVGCKITTATHRKFRILAAKRSLSASALFKELVMQAVSKIEAGDSK